MRKLGLIAALSASALALTACSGNADNGGSNNGSAAGPGDKLTMVNVVKLVGVGWFDRMEVGVKEFASESGHNATQTGGDDASPEKQVQIIQDLVAQKPAAIGVVPNSPEALEAVLKRARDAGIIVVSHEATSQQNIDADIEAFDNTAYGAEIAEAMAQCMGGEGTYAAFVGQLTAQTHMEWVEGGLQHITDNYPGISRIGGPIEAKEDEQVAYERTKELLISNPDIKGIQGSASTDIAGAARAIEEAGLEDQICVMGTSIPSVSGKYLESGAVDKMFFWDPAMAGKAMMKMAEMLAKGEEIKDGTDLGIEGYTNLKVSPDNPKVFYGDASIAVDLSNIDEFDFI